MGRLLRGVCKYIYLASLIFFFFFCPFAFYGVVWWVVGSMNLYLSCALSSLLIRFVFSQFSEIASSSYAVWALRKRSGATAQFLCVRKAEAEFASRRACFSFLS